MQNAMYTTDKKRHTHGRRDFREKMSTKFINTSAVYFLTTESVVFVQKM